MAVNKAVVAQGVGAVGADGSDPNLATVDLAFHAPLLVTAGSFPNVPVRAKCPVAILHSEVAVRTAAGMPF